ncbi:energy-coupling factor transporter ATPase [Pelolinea submarina]|uniref:Energy-coupling factor transport system ATP-binding protein n=1 Tax=Pelolinea submarina TaxID=913107 RepID=A0A347ZQ07_9CHLR|nr:energy-coupling factor transporter ATPase [Pelolinea submarina]REG06283.1 energy-coupling factor transport system ATP-binding protein [Pelolinea submarina]BBB47388.1 ABC transport system ATP-binding protein [Pelolinea submarina]
MPDFIIVENISFSYPSREGQTRAALKNIQFNIQAGEFATIIGPNGSGKSTLARLLNALLLPDSGRVLIDGMDTRDYNNHAQIHSQVGLVFQRPQNQIVATTVEEDVAFGPANLGLDSAVIHERVDSALRQTGLSNYRQRPSHLLSAGETQRLALAGVLAMQPRCIIFDETTAMLDPMGRAMVMEQIRTLHHQGITVLLITHLMEEAALADRILLLHDGQLVLDGTPKNIFSGNHAMEQYGLGLPHARQAALELRKYFPQIAPDILTSHDLFQSLPDYTGNLSISSQNDPLSNNTADDFIQISHLSFVYQRNTPLAHKALDGLNFTMKEQHTHALIGATGCGKSTLLQHLNGLLRPQSGSVRVGSFDLSAEDLDVQALRRMVVLAFQQPEDQIFEQYVGDEIAYAPRHLGYQGKIADVVEQAMLSVGLDFETYKDRLTSTLSGGEKRKVALASILAIQSRLVLLDEPLAGLDPRSVDELMRTLDRQRGQGKSLLISTHQYEEIIPILQDVSLLYRGHDFLQGEAQSVFSQTAKLEEAGLKAPLAAQITDALRQKGWPLSTPIASMERLSLSLAALTQGEPHE